MSNPAVYTDSVGYPPSNSTALGPVNGDPTALVADATDPDTIVYGAASGSLVFAVSTSFLAPQDVDTSRCATVRGMT